MTIEKIHLKAGEKLSEDQVSYIVDICLKRYPEIPELYRKSASSENDDYNIQIGSYVTSTVYDLLEVESKIDLAISQTPVFIELRKRISQQ